jgi:hypothetical protein
MAVEAHGRPAGAILRCASQALHGCPARVDPAVGAYRPAAFCRRVSTLPPK